MQCIVINKKRFEVKYRYSCQTLMKLEFSPKILAKTEVSNFNKIMPVGAELFHADGQT